MSEMKRVKSIMIVAGEASGDAHAASLVTALREVDPTNQFSFFGATGPLMRAVGVESIVESDHLSILGLLEIGRALPNFWRAYKALKQAADERKPWCVVLVDWPDFNLRLARHLHDRGIRVIYYISPQLWAWRPHRVRNIKRDVDLVLSILPFEKDWFAARGVEHVEFVGHPLVGEVYPRYSREEFCRRNNLNPALPIVTLLPGSRQKELLRILPPMLDAAQVLLGRHPELQAVVVVAPNRTVNEAREIISARADAKAITPRLTLVQDETREALAASAAAAVASGTATLEAALLGVPMVVVYKESAINWHTLGRLITTEHFGLVNLIAGKRLMTELIQDALNGETLARELSFLLEPARAAHLRAELRELRERLGDGGASRRAAEKIIAHLSRKPAV